MNRVGQTRSFSSDNQNQMSLSSGILALACGVVAGTTNADEASAKTEQAEEIDEFVEVIEVYGTKKAPYKALRSGDLRRSAELAATPQTMTILTQKQMLDSGKTDLKEILSSQAGVTLGTGENGNAFGDRYIIRGHEARSDVFVDGVRDPGMTTRESFATEQIEITKGPSSTFAGRGSSGGAVNGITKEARLKEDFGLATGGFGTSDFHRITVDINEPLSDSFAVRGNFLHADEEVPNRGPAARKRVGGLLSGLWQTNERLSFAADYYRLQADDLPDIGGYFDRSTRKPVEDVPVYLQNGDFLDTEIDSFTFKTRLDVNDTFTLHNVLRDGRTDNGYVVTGARGTTRASTDPNAPGASTFSLSTHQGWQDVDYIVNQLNLVWEDELASISHRFVVGVEYSDEEVRNGLFSYETTGTTNCMVSGRRGTFAGYCGLDPAGEPVPDINALLGRVSERGNQDSHFQVNTVSAYVMDSFEFGPNWRAFLGIRHDRFDYANRVVRRGATTDYTYADGFWNGHAGVARNVNDYGNVYLTLSTATNINGGESDVGSSCGYGGLCGTPDQVDHSDPEQVRNLELGTKWQFFDNRLLVTAAIFQMTKSDVMESVGDAYSSLGTLNTGKNRVNGVEVSLAGSLSDRLSAQFGAAFMDSEVLEAHDQEDVGLALANFANNSLYGLLRYQATQKFAVGGSLT